MGRKSQTNYDQSRDKRYSAYVYIGEYKFRKSICKHRSRKTNDCLRWEHEYLDLTDKEDSEFVKSTMILLSESEL